MSRRPKAPPRRARSDLKKRHVPPVAPPPAVVRFDKRAALTFVVITALAFGVRAIHVQEARSVAFFTSLISDGQVYDEWAHGIASGDWSSSKMGVFYQAPLYPYFLAVLHVLLGHDLWAIRLAQAVLSALACGVIYLAGCRFFGRRVGIVAGVILALYAPAIFLDTLIQKSVLDALFGTLLLTLAACLAQPAPRRRLLLPLALGIVAGFFALSRENALILAVVLAGWLMLRREGGAVRERFTSAGTFAVGVALVLLPVGVRNLRVGHEFALTTSQAGPNFYIGNHPGAPGIYVPLRKDRGTPFTERQDATELAEQAVGHKLTPSQVSRYWLDRSLAFIGEQPGEWFDLLRRKLLYTLNWFEIFDTEDQYYYERHCPLLRWLSLVGHFGVLVPLTVLGIVLTWPRRRELVLLYVLFVTLLASIVLFYVFARYRYPLVPYIVLFAAAGIVGAIDAVRQRRWAPLAIAAVLMVPAGMAANAVIFEPRSTLAGSAINASAALLESGRVLDAIESAREAIQYEPRFVLAYEDLAMGLRQCGRLHEAVDVLRIGLSYGPNTASLHACLGGTLLRLGDKTAAAAELNQALALFRDDPVSLSELGRLRLMNGDAEQALALLRNSAAAADYHLGLRMNLAWGLAVCPDERLRNGVEAVALAAPLVAANPSLSNDIFSLEALAAAFAESGRFPEAVETQQRALDMATRRGADSLVIDEFTRALASYREHRPQHVEVNR
jgi:4-amino-4-deoxy-L-arabinose transferase-like glycosyltransferase